MNRDLLSRSSPTLFPARGDASLVGRAVLVVEPAIGQFASNAQDALERRGAETLTVRGLGEACERLRAFRFMTCLINYDHACDALNASIGDLGDISDATSTPATVPGMPLQGD